MKINAIFQKLTATFQQMLGLQVLLAWIGYVLAAQLAISFAIMKSGIAILWLPNAVILTALLLSERKNWVWFSGAALAGEWVSDIPLFSVWQATGFGLTNVFECVLAASLLRKLCGSTFSFGNLRQVIVFGVVAILIAPGLAALLGAAVYVVSSPDDASFWAHWKIWWLGDGLGLIALTPVLISFLSPATSVYKKSASPVIEGALLATALLVVCALLFVPVPDANSFWMLSPFLLLPLFMWSAVRFGVRGVSLAGSVVCVISVVYSTYGRGIFSLLPPELMTVVIQQFLASLLLSGVALAAIFQELQVKNEGLRLFEAVIAQMGEGIAITDMQQPDMPITYVNPRFETLTGYSAADVLGKNCRFLNQRDRTQPEVVQMRNAINAHLPFQVTLRNFRKNGEAFWNSVTASPVHDDKGNVTHFIGIQRDVSDILDTQDQLNRACQELQTLNQELEQRVSERTQALEKLATTDPLTGTYNRRFLMDRAEIEIALAKRQSYDLSLVMLDIDWFKSVNDTYGHSVGDRVLILLCDTVKRELRLGDMLARIGGEEFVMLLPHANLATAQQVAERLRTQVAGLTLLQDSGAVLQFTSSFGVATMNDSIATVDELLKAADQALYKAKNAGRNQVHIFA
jgi:diguanylate cyclase (GGDEF)-like protein/PAS domain S-box-containing protein